MPSRPGTHNPVDARLRAQREAERQDRRRRAFDRNRPSRHARGYGITHERWRAMVLARCPMCAHCGVAAATDADHIDGDVTNRSLDNGQGLCKPCHSRKTRRQTAERRTTSTRRRSR